MSDIKLSPEQISEFALQTRQLLEITNIICDAYVEASKLLDKLGKSSPTEGAREAAREVSKVFVSDKNKIFDYRKGLQKTVKTLNENNL